MLHSHCLFSRSRQQGKHAWASDLGTRRARVWPPSMPLNLNVVACGIIILASLAHLSTACCLGICALQHLNGRAHAALAHSKERCCSNALLRAFCVPVALTGSGRQWMSWIHRDDLVDLIVESLKNPAYSGTYNATAPKPVRMSELCSALGAHAGGAESCACDGAGGCTCVNMCACLHARACMHAASKTHHLRSPLRTVLCLACSAG